MKVHYKGFELDAHREKCLGGWSMLYYSAVRESDGWEMISSFSDSADTVRDMIKDLKKSVDDYYLHPKDYEEG